MYAGNFRGNRLESAPDLARRIRSTHGARLPVLMISADAGPERNHPDYRALHDGYLVKPIALDALLGQLGSLLSVQWVYDGPGGEEGDEDTTFGLTELPCIEDLHRLQSLGQAGLTRSAHTALTEIESVTPAAQRFCAHLRQLIDNDQLTDFIAAIEKARTHAA